MCIVRRVEEEYRALNPPEDDGESLFRQVLGRLEPEELAEWRRQVLEIEKLYPLYDTFMDCVDAFEREHPEAA